MTRANISISRDLKRRMDSCGEKVNWSKVACEGFQKELLKRHGNMKKRFVSIPREIEAEQFLGLDKPLPDGVFVSETGSNSFGIVRMAFVITAHKQKVYLEVGDWVVPEMNGDGHYPIKPEIMAKSWREKPNGE